jgi:hypothetical protein
MMDQNNNLNFYKQVLSICESCSLYLETDQECLIEEKKIFDMLKEKNSSCPIGEW